MKYDFKCEDCSHKWEVTMRADEFRDTKEEGIPCPSCESGTAFNEFNPGNIQVSYKGLQWADKNYKEKSYRKDRAAYMESRQSKNLKRPTLRPNYKGETTKNWKEARDAARDDGALDFTYDHKVLQEDQKK